MHMHWTATVGGGVCFLLAFSARAGGAKHDGDESSCSPAVTLTALAPSDAHCPTGGVRISTACAGDDDHKRKDKDKDRDKDKDADRRGKSERGDRDDGRDDDDGDDCKAQVAYVCNGATGAQGIAGPQGPVGPR